MHKPHLPATLFESSLNPGSFVSHAPPRPSPLFFVIHKSLLHRSFFFSFVPNPPITTATTIINHVFNSESAPAPSGTPFTLGRLRSRCKHPLHCQLRWLAVPLPLRQTFGQHGRTWHTARSRPSYRHQVEDQDGFTRHRADCVGVWCDTVAQQSSAQRQRKYS